MSGPRVRRATSPPPRATGTGWRFPSLPADLLDQSCRRVGIAALTFAGLWAFALLMNLVVSPLIPGEMPIGEGTWPIPGIPVAAAGLVLSLGMIGVANKLHDRPNLLLDLGLGFEVLTAALVGFLGQWEPVLATGRISWICAIVLIYPAIAPNTPGKTFAAAVTAASMDPLWYGVALLRGFESDVTTFALVWSFGANYLCALLAVVPAHIIQRLGRQVSRARELGSYRLGEKLGGGGMGEVFRAEHRLLARPAAIKLIRPELLGGNGQQADVLVERFRREAEAAAILRSPHTIELYDFGIADDGAFYYVMELLDGVPFDALVDRFGPLPAERAVYLMLQAADSLAEAHARGLMHRDVKPSNLFASRVGLTVDFVKVLDFGLVKREGPRGADDAMLTAPDIATGTPAFMAPEVALGDPDVDHRVDVYALGCVLYWLLTGRLVFEADQPLRLMHKHISEPPVPPSQRTELVVPAALDELVLACLQKRRENRPAHAGELATRLAALGLAEQWTRERARRWWELNLPDSGEPCGPCDQGEVVPALAAATP